MLSFEAVDGQEKSLGLEYFYQHNLETDKMNLLLSNFIHITAWIIRISILERHRFGDWGDEYEV